MQVRKLAFSHPGATDCLHYVLVHDDGGNNDDHDLEMDSDNDDDDDGEEQCETVYGSCPTMGQSTVLGYGKEMHTKGKTIVRIPKKVTTTYVIGT